MAMRMKDRMLTIHVDAAIRVKSVYLTSAAASESAPAVVDEEWIHSLHLENIWKYRYLRIHLQVNNRKKEK